MIHMKRAEATPEELYDIQPPLVIVRRPACAAT